MTAEEWDEKVTALCRETAFAPSTATRAVEVLFGPRPVSPPEPLALAGARISIDDDRWIDFMDGLFRPAEFRVFAERGIEMCDYLEAKHG